MRYTLRPLGEQVIVITGASSGIGLVTAMQAAAAGAKVLLVARDENALGDAVGRIVAAGGTAAYALADVGNPAEVEAAAALAVERFGRIDTWVNNAGIAIYATLMETPIEEHARMFQTNYFGVVNGAKAAFPYLRKSGGALVTVASIAADIPSPILSAYSASKHAVKGYINSLRIEYVIAEEPISVTLIKPSGIDTPIGRHAANHEPREAMIPPPVYAPELVAQAILEAAEHSRREIIVGGGGRLQVLLGTHFPRMLDHLSRFVAPLLTDPTRAPTPADSLFAPSGGDQEHSGVVTGRNFSVYTYAVRHRTATGLGLALVAGAGIAALARRRT